VRDLDLAVAGDPSGLAARIASEVAGIWRSEPRFGTATVHAGDDRLDLAALRTDHYTRPGALPRVRLGASIEDDLARRDFTVNAIALGLHGPVRDTLVDPFGGLGDLDARCLRALHERLFIDDATRLWRGARYAARLQLRPDAATARLIEDGGRWLAPISAKRLWAEFELTAGEPRVAAVATLLDDWGVLEAVHPAFHLAPETKQALRPRRGPMRPEVLMAVLLAPFAPESRAAISRRLGAPRAALRAVDAAARLLEVRDGTPETLRALEDVSDDGLAAALWLDPSRQREFQRALRRWRQATSPLTARDLKAIGIEEGPMLGAVLGRLRRERYLGTLTGAEDARRKVLGWASEEIERR
jgi:tRNA nucleotidyltransferase (CCA-adding enzyme)